MDIMTHSHLRRTIILSVACLFVIPACRSQTPARAPNVVSLSPAITEIIFALKEQDHLVGVTTYCTYPEQAQSITKVGDFSNPSLERIVGLKPDLVIVNTPEQKRIKHQLEQLHIQTFASEPRTMQDVYTEILEIGEHLHATEKAESIVQHMKTVIQPVKRSERRVYVELSPRPLVTIGSTTFLNELIAMAGGRNVFDDRDNPYPVVAQEVVIQRDPEIIIILHPESFGNRVGWSNVSAVQNNRIYHDLNQDHLMRPGPRLVLGYSALVDVIND
jgi:iron complex transport system substrate-binding protein